MKPFLTLLLILFLAVPSQAQTVQVPEPAPRSTEALAGEAAQGTNDWQALPGPGQVVLLHGVLMHSLTMELLASRLRAAGYEVLNVDYPSTQHRLEELAVWLERKLGPSVDPGRPLHFVGHSMGGLVIRAYLNGNDPPNLGRVVHLGTPNNGSEMADLLKNVLPYRALFGPAGQQLVTESEEVLRILGPVDFPLGVIAGSGSVDIAGSLVIPGPDDGKVSVESTRVEGMADHVVLNVAHGFLPTSADVSAQVISFLKSGRFQR